MAYLDFSADVVEFVQQADIARATLTVRNTSPSTHVAFKVKTNAAERYSVKPHMALLSPGEAKIMQLSVSSVQMPRFREEMARQLREGKRTTAFLIMGWAVPEDIARQLREVEGVEEVARSLQTAWKAREAEDKEQGKSSFEQRKFPSLLREAAAVVGSPSLNATIDTAVTREDPIDPQQGDVMQMMSTSAFRTVGMARTGVVGGDVPAAAPGSPTIAAVAAALSTERRKADDLKAALARKQEEIDEARAVADAARKEVAALRTKLEEAQAVAAAEAAAALRQRRGSGGGKGRARDEAATQQIEGASAGGISGSALPLWVVLFVAIMCFLLGRLQLI